MSSTKIVLTTPMIIEAYNAHGKDMVVPDLDNIRAYKQYMQYIDIHIRLADNTVCPVRYWKLSDAGIVLGSRIRKPEERKFDRLRIGIALKDNDDDEEPNENALALQYICTAFEDKMKELKKADFITDDVRLPRKQADGTMRPIYLINLNISSPMQTVVRDRDTGDNKDLENPRFWLSLKHKFFKQGTEPEKEVMEGMYYIDSDGQPDMARPVYRTKFANEFYDVDSWYHHARSGRKFYNKFGAPADGEEGDLDNTNIQNYLTRGSAMMGGLKFELTISGRQCKLDISLFGSYYVKRADEVDNGGAPVDEAAIGNFSSKYASLGSAEATPDLGIDAEEQDTDDF